jgi:hypothetical protein
MISSVPSNVPIVNASNGGKTREAGVVYSKPWMVDLVLDLAGYLPERRLAELVLL